MLNFSYIKTGVVHNHGNKTFLYIGAGILFLIGVCLFGYGILSVIGSTSAQGSAMADIWDRIRRRWRALPCGGHRADLCRTQDQKRGHRSEDNITYKVDLPCRPKIEQMKCRSCGGT